MMTPHTAVGEITEMKTTYRLIYVSPDENSNKFWFSTIEDKVEKRTWGRVGSSGQHKTFTYYSHDEACVQVAAKAKSKFKKGYKEAQLLIDGGTTQVGNLDLRTLALSQIDTDGSSETKRLIEFLVDTNIHTITMNTSITYSGGQLKTALGVITKDAIRDARRLLADIADMVNRNAQMTKRFDRVVADYLVVVPTKVGRKLVPADLFGSQDKIDKQVAILDAMDALVVVNGDAGNEAMFAMSIKPVSDKVFAQLDAARKKTSKSGHQSASLRMKRAWKVTITNDQYDDSVGNVLQLWHGTKASNLLSIFRKGLTIVPSGASHTTGRMYGDGLYFSDVFTKALNYATTFWGGRDEGRYFVLLADVAMGRAYRPSDGYGRQSLPRPGYDSTFAEAGQSGTRNNEQIVYAESQAKIRYLLEFVR